MCEWQSLPEGKGDKLFANPSIILSDGRTKRSLARSNGIFRNCW